MALRATLAEERTARRVAAMTKLKADLPLFAAEMLKIRPKDVIASPIVSLVYNRTQLSVHRAAEDQIRRTGRVRALVGKGRKTTVSTYVISRGFHRTIFNRGYSAYIMAQAQETADELFDMVKRFH